MAHDVIPPDVQHHAMPIVIVGHVDHGKSTLVGRLLHDTGSLPEEKVAQMRAISAKRGLEIEWSFLLDSLQVERDQGITLDTTQVWFHTARRRYVVIDAPGHKEFLRNMLSGAASADAAVLVVDAGVGLGEQTRRHAHILELIGLRQVAVAVNKMDLIGYDAAKFSALAEEIRAFLAGLRIEPAAIIPLSARHGDNVAAASARMDWYTGPTLVEAIDLFRARASLSDQPLRLPVQDLYRRDDRRIVVGRIESGALRVGDALRFAPLGTIARVARIETWNNVAPKLTAVAGESVALTLDDEIFVERGHIASTPDWSPTETNVIAARVIWLDAEGLTAGRRLTLRIATARHEVVVEAIERVFDTQDSSSQEGERVERNGVAVVRLRSRSRMAVDSFVDNPRTGRGVLLDGYRVVGGCVVERAVENQATLVAPAPSVALAERAGVAGHAGGVLWLTGLSGSGKSTLAMGLMRRLFESGRQVYVLDGDTLRQGLNRDLGFSPADRSENIRRTAEVARLFADAGFIVIAALISPAAADRQAARQIVGEGFHEIHVRADIDVCQARDPKQLYRRAVAGEITQFTGVSAPYEAPTRPDLVIDTTQSDVARSLDALEGFATATFTVRRDLSRLAS